MVVKQVIGIDDLQFVQYRVKLNIRQQYFCIVYQYLQLIV